MKNIKSILAIFTLIAVVGCKNNQNKEETVEPIEKEVVEIEKQDIKYVSFGLEAKSESTASGKVEFKEVNGVVFFEARVGGLTPGSHAIHIHETADCSAADGTSTGGHWNPTFAPHGKWGAAEGFHKGDIGNFEADENGNGTISMQTDEWCIGCGDPNKDIIGKAIIVHQGVDDFKTQPTGDAGGRVSCGGIIQ